MYEEYLSLLSRMVKMKDGFKLILKFQFELGWSIHSSMLSDIKEMQVY